MQIEAGKTYVDGTRSKVSIGVIDPAIAPFPVIGETIDGRVRRYTKHGRFNSDGEPHIFDLVAEWQGEHSPTVTQEEDGTYQIRPAIEPESFGTAYLPEYEPLGAVLQEAFAQAATGKGSERHANGKPFLEQPIMSIGRMCGLGFQTGQIQKKVQEATSMAARGDSDAAIREILGAINYAAAAILLIREQRRA